MSAIYVGVDGGNSKTEVAVCDARGQVLRLVRGEGSSPDKIGYTASVRLVTDLVKDALAGAEKHLRVRSIRAYIAGLDLPEQVIEFQERVDEHFPEIDVLVGNDTQAVLLAGTGGDPGIVLVCGAGINGMYRDASGDSSGFLALGLLTGDWGGGISFGREALFHAVRMEDYRGPSTLLRGEVLDLFGAETAVDVALSIHRGERHESHLAELVAGVFKASETGDPLAKRIVERQVDELMAMTSALAKKAGLQHAEAPLVMAGGVLSAQDSPVAEGLIERLAYSFPSMRPKHLGVRPVAGSLIGALEGGLGNQLRGNELNVARRGILTSSMLLVAGQVDHSGEFFGAAPASVNVMPDVFVEPEADHTIEA